MKKRYIVTISIVLLIIIFIAIIYTYENNKIKQENVKKYVQCLNLASTNQTITQENLDFFKRTNSELASLEYVSNCVRGSGCLNPCGSPCDKSHITLSEIFLSYKQKACAEVCVPRCFYPPGV